MLELAGKDIQVFIMTVETWKMYEIQIKLLAL